MANRYLRHSISCSQAKHISLQAVWLCLARTAVPQDYNSHHACVHNDKMLLWGKGLQLRAQQGGFIYIV